MYKVSDEVRSTHSQDGGIVLHIGQGKMYNLNPVGSRILELLKEGSSRLSIAGKIAAEFEIELNLAENDVWEFLQTLQKLQLIEDGF